MTLQNQASKTNGDVDDEKSAMSSNVEIPNGAIQAISTAATAALAIEIAFLGYWAFGPQTAATPWSWRHLFGITPLAVAFYFLANVPYLASSPDITAKKFLQVRDHYRLGMISLAIGLAVSLLLSV